jgi:hypothetical protein
MQDQANAFNLQNTKERLDLLFSCLIYCTNMQNVGRAYIFTVAERILINQERAALMSQITAHELQDDSELRHFQVPNKIEQKIQFLKSKL